MDSFSGVFRFSGLKSKRAQGKADNAARPTTKAPTANAIDSDFGGTHGDCSGSSAARRIFMGSTDNSAGSTVRFAKQRDEHAAAGDQARARARPR